MAYHSMCLDITTVQLIILQNMICCCQIFNPIDKCNKFHVSHIKFLGFKDNSPPHKFRKGASVLGTIAQVAVEGISCPDTSF